VRSYRCCRTRQRYFEQHIPLMTTGKCAATDSTASLPPRKTMYLEQALRRSFNDKLLDPMEQQYNRTIVLTRHSSTSTGRTAAVDTASLFKLFWNSFGARTILPPRFDKQNPCWPSHITCIAPNNSSIEKSFTMCSVLGIRGNTLYRQYATSIQT
jgi:hypothetical protein